MGFLLTLILMTQPSHAGVGSWCRRVLVMTSENFPMAEMPTNEVLLIFDKIDSADALKELLFRAKNGMLSRAEIARFNQLLDMNELLNKKLQ